MPNLEEEKKKIKEQYEYYIRQHTGENIDKSDYNKNVEQLSKVMAAIILGSSGTLTYSKKLIDITADKLKRTLYLKEQPQVTEVKTALSSKNAARSLMEEQMYKNYQTQNGAELISDMKTLLGNMMSSADRSPEYKAMVMGVKRIAEMDPASVSSIKGQSALIVANSELMRRIDGYMKGKKSVRRSDDGKERFNNALDALAVLNKHVKGAESITKDIVGRINQVRNANNEMHKDYVDIDNFGPKRAARAKEERQAKQEMKAGKANNAPRK